MSLRLHIRGSGVLTASSLETATASHNVALLRVEPDVRGRRGVPRLVRHAAGPVVLVLLWHVLSISGVLPEGVLAGPKTAVSSTLDLLASSELQAAM
jgi:sulfonate transport system permease protein